MSPRPLVAPVPDGYVRLTVPGVDAVAASAHVGAVRLALRDGTLYDWARTHPLRREMMGRGPVYAVPLPGEGAHVVVRHARHGGMLARATGDRFLRPRAARELGVALRLAAAGVPTPPVLAYVLYPAGPLLRRADTATQLVAGARDLAAALADVDPAAREAAIDATGALLRAMAAAGARHPDLNVKNVLLAAPAGDSLCAWVLDVDRVRFGRAGSTTAVPNAQRLRRSLDKRRSQFAPGAVDAAIRSFAA